MTVDAAGRAWIKELLNAAMRLAGVTADCGSAARALALLETALADGPRLTRAAGADLEPMTHPGRPAAGS